MFNNEQPQETHLDDIDTMIDEASNADDSNVSHESITLSSGVVFTQEELNNMDPVVLEKLLKVKSGDENFSRGINAKAKRVKELEAQIAALQTPKKEVTPTPAPEAGTKSVGITEQYVMRQMARENFAKAKNVAIQQYGAEAVDIIGEKFAKLFQELVEVEGKFDADFNGIYSQAFVKLLADAEDKRVFDAFARFKNGITAEALKAEAEAKAKLELLNSKNSTTTGLPAGGAPVVAAPANNSKPSSLAEARMKWREGIEKMKNKGE